MLAADTILGLRKTREWVANAGSTAATLIGGHNALAVAGGTATARAFSNASFKGQVHRLGWDTAATAGAIVTVRNSAVECSLQQGFLSAFRFNIADPASVPAARMFLGTRNSGAALTNVEPSTLLNVCGIGHDSGDTNLQIYGSDGTARARLDLGTSFPVAPGTDTFYDFAVCAMGSIVAWRAMAWHDGNTPVVKSGKFQYRTFSAITHFTAFRTNNTTAAVVGLDLAKIHLNTM